MSTIEKFADKGLGEEFLESDDNLFDDIISWSNNLF